MSSLPKDYGYVLLSASAGFATVTWMGMNVSKGRKKYGVPYPKMYSETEETFNCIQRAHQNTLESFPSFLFFLAFSGLHCPKSAAVCGGLWSLGRIVFAKGYTSGNPDNRKYGFFGQFALLGMVGGTVAFALKKLEVM